MIRYHTEAEQIHGEDSGQFLHARLKPVFPVVKIAACEGVLTAKKGPADTAPDAVIDADFGFIDDLPTGIGRHASTSECCRQCTSATKPVKRPR